MRFIKVKSYKELSEIAGDIIISQIKEKSDSVIGLATGSTPVGTYDYIVNKYKKGEVDFSKVRTINLDEYIGLSKNHDQSYRYFMDKHLFNNININKSNTYVPNGMVENIEEECKNYDARIEEFGGIDIQLLGIGIDGHIGFNEPDEVFTKETHEVKLDQSTIEANSRFFESIEDVPKSAITIGMKGIMGAKKIILIASGENKKEILEKAMFGEITPHIPASILQLHNDVTVIYSEN